MANTKPGERKLQILQALAAMLEQPRGDRITTAALAARLDVSEAALYRHFASKAQMFEGLIEFIETSVFGLINKIGDTEENGIRQVRSIAGMLLEFAEQNPGMTRVMIGDALVNEDERLQLRMPGKPEFRKTMQENQQWFASLPCTRIVQAHAIRQRCILLILDGGTHWPSPFRPACSFSRTCGTDSYGSLGLRPARMSSMRRCTLPSEPGCE